MLGHDAYCDSKRKASRQRDGEKSGSAHDMMRPLPRPTLAVTLSVSLSLRGPLFWMETSHDDFTSDRPGSFVTGEYLGEETTTTSLVTVVLRRQAQG